VGIAAGLVGEFVELLGAPFGLVAFFGNLIAPTAVAPILVFVGISIIALWQDPSGSGGCRYRRGADGLRGDTRQLPALA